MPASIGVVASIVVIPTTTSESHHAVSHAHYAYASLLSCCRTLDIWRPFAS